jgi:hypothetical protein
MTDAIKPSRPLTRKSMGIQAGLPLEASQGGIDELRRDIQRLMDMEAIRQLKHAYFRCIDTANFEELATLFHDDVSVHLKGGNYEWKLQGKQEYLDSIRQSLHTGAIGHHNGHQPEIQILSGTEATGIWYLADNMWMVDHEFFTTGTALYWDRYLKVDGRWTIKDTKYERIYELNEKRDIRQELSVHYLKSNGTDLSKNA